MVFKCCVCVDLNHYWLTSTVGWCYQNMLQCFITHFMLFHYLYVMQSVCELNLFLPINNTCLNNQCCPLQSSLLGTCVPLILALFEPFCTAYHLNWTNVWWLCLNLGEVSKSPVSSWIVGKAQLRTKKKQWHVLHVWASVSCLFWVRIWWAPPLVYGSYH